MSDSTSDRHQVGDIVTVIDIGSNSIRLSAYGVDDTTSKSDSASSETVPKRLFGKKEMAGLASYVGKDGALTDKGIARAIAAISQLHALSVGVGATKEFAFATASLRNVSNTEDAVEKIQNATGVPITVLSGEQEALLGYESLKLVAKPNSGLMADIGGGSTELAEFDNKQLEKLTSLSMGSLKLYSENVKGILPTAKEAKCMNKSMKRLLNSDLIKDWTPSQTLYAMGGSARAFQKLMNIHGHEGTTFAVSDMKPIIRDLCSGDQEGFKPVLQACPDRIHTLVPGMIIIRSVCKHFGIKTVVVTSTSVRDSYVTMALQGKI